MSTMNTDTSQTLTEFTKTVHELEMLHEERDGSVYLGRGTK